MDLKKRFQAATSCSSVKIGDLEVERKYPIIRAERVETKFGQSVLLTILDSPMKSIKVFLPKSYSAVMTDVDIDDINSKRVSLHLIYKGTCVKTKSYISAIE
jgi:hypothetical protein